MTGILARDPAAVVTGGSLLLPLLVSAAAGLVSFASPCVLPLVPGYLSYVTGLSAAQVVGDEAPAGRRRYLAVVVGTLLFVAGFSTVFVSFGALFGGLGGVLRDHQVALSRVFGAVTVLLGLAFAGLLDRVPLANREWRFHRTPGTGIGGAPVLGLMFGLGWTPCIGPTLSAVLGMAASGDSASALRGTVLALAYCVGLGLPFLLTGLAFQRMMSALGPVRRHRRAFGVLGGALLVLIGIAEMTGWWRLLLGWMQARTAGFAVPF